MSQQLKGIHVLTVGDSISADGVETFHTGYDLQEIADTYNSSVHEAPVILGHSSDPDWSKLLTRNDSFPAYGWIQRAYVDGNDLYVDLDASEELVEFIEKKRYKKRSIGYYGRDSKNNPAPGKLYIRHLAMLGSSPPAIKGLEDVKLSEEETKMPTPDETKQLLDKNAANWLAFMLKDGGNVVRESIVAFDPEPSSENSYLYDPEAGKWAGAFITDDQDKFNFEITRKGEEFVIAVKAADPSEPGEVPTEEEAVPEETGEVNLTEENQMSKLLKEKTITEKEYAPDMVPQEDPALEVEMRDDGKVDPEEAEHGNPSPASTDPVLDTEDRSATGTSHSGTINPDYKSYVEMMEKMGEQCMGEQEYMTYMEDPAHQQEMTAKYMEYMGGIDADMPVTMEEEEVADVPGEPVPGEEAVAPELGAETPEVPAEGEDIELMEKYKAMEDELNMLREKVKSQEEEEMKAREEEMITFAEGIYDSSKLLESQFKKDDLVALMQGLLHLGNEHMVYGEGENQKNVLDTVKELITNLPEQVKLAEGLVQAKPVRNAVKFDPNFSKGSQERREKIRAIMTERNIPFTNMHEYVRIAAELQRTDGDYNKD